MAKASLTGAPHSARMKRRELIALAGPTRGESPAEAPSLDLAALGLPVIAGGRVRNYVFVNIRLHLAAGADLARARSREPYFRDALVRAGHRSPFTLADDWNRLDGEAIARSIMAAAPGLAGAGVVRRAEIVSQTPQRRTAVRPG